MKMRVIVVAVALVVAVGGGAYYYLLGEAPASPGTKPGANAARGQRPPQPVIVQTVRTEEFVDRLEAIGTLSANESITVTAKMQGIVRGIYFEDGQTIAKDQPIAAIDSGEQAAQLNIELANLEQQRRELARVETLAKTNNVSQVKVDDIRTALKRAEANVAAARVRAGDRLLTAPFSGILGTRKVSLGALVSPGAVITTLDDVSQVKLDFSVPETFLPSLKPGLQLEATSATYPGEVFKGQVIAVESRVNVATRSIGVRAIINNDDQRLRGGMLMVVELIKDRRNSIVIAEEALIATGEKHFVFVVDQATKTAKRVEVTLGRRRPGFIEIRTGLKADDLVVTEGTQLLSPGAPVQILAGPEGSKPGPDAARR